MWLQRSSAAAVAKAAAKAATAVATVTAFATLAVATGQDAVVDGKCAVAIIGGGIGGVYTAWRLAVDTNTVKPSDVCIFERADRFGGRIFSMDDVPGYKGYVTDMGAYRFHRQEHPLTRALVEDALELETACYTDLTTSLPMDVRECPKAVRKFVTTRTVTFMGDLDADKAPDLSAWTQRVPYFLSEDERWGPGQSRRERRRLTDVFSGSKSLIPELSSRWDRLVDENTTFEAAMALADEAIGAVRRGKYKGVPYADVSVVQVARDVGMSAEELAMEEGFQSVGATIFNGNLLQQLILTIRKKALERLPLAAKAPAADMVLPVTGKGKSRKRAGMLTIIKAMLKAARDAGVRVYTGHHAVGVYRWDRSTLRVEFADGGYVTARRVFLNMGKADLRSLGAGSEPMASASADAARRVDATLSLGASKTYCFWPSAWWLADLRLSAGDGQAQGPAISATRYHDGPVTCADAVNLTSCRGGLLVSYQFGDETQMASGLWGASHADAPYSPTSGTDAVTVLERRRLSPRQRLAWNALVEGLRDAHGPVVAARNRSADGAIPEPDVCVLASWFETGLHIHRATTTLSGSSPGELFAAPAPGLAVHLVNEAWGDSFGWAEGSLQSAERALHAHMQLPPPSWLNGLVHKAIIREFNNGS
ncbi:hypothetical protein MMPV_003097 [Pyropia vietnamensis]